MVRWVHIACALVWVFIGPVWRWACEPERRLWAPTALLAAGFFAAFLPFDGPISRGLAGVRLGGDIRRELEAIQQYGQGVSSCLIALVIWLQDPRQRRRLADWLAAVLVCGVIVNAMKMLVGRPRPQFDDPWRFLGPFGQYPIGRNMGVHHAWEFWEDISSRLWSMPSSHTAYACIMAVFIGTVYPRLRGLALAVALLVGLGRVITTAHYPTDVIVGAALGLIVGRLAVRGRWGQRVLEGRNAAAEHRAGDAPAHAPEEALSAKAG